ncbi:alanyl-tRNA synthetase [Cyclobacterium xiamenense]|uniref:Alanine--tRNA ligase n=1 Tax=Cyclobacterium xiamenense TaxID=1297121 RepID=A0A1H6YV11_9BACT|nr:alanine--tRNA ligase [Cyclobacterium xiamenense]SEJ45113.1 alanyl-tRNA synthetase [Cyclobacterium xiamenense]
MNSKQIRSQFIEFFQSKKHQFVSSAPIVVKNDPSLMFTNAGMNQFKDFFLGNEVSDHPRITNSQKCLRVSGKHNDLEEVGVDTYHHTMFEMLGNWSFGDYFKKEAIAWAWELLTEVYKLPVDRMYVTVFGGDSEDGLEADKEAFSFWEDWVPRERILFGSKKDNFWEMGETGPCGPCSEIHIDMRSPEEIAQVPGKDLVNADHPQVIEIWNLVFIQFNRFSDGRLNELPSSHVDTGMGLERLVRVIQNKTSNYDTDLFAPFIEKVEQVSGYQYGQSEKIDIAFRVIVDHIRAISFTIADGQLPSNNKAGYVIRRILRRAVRYGYTFLDLKVPFLHLLVPVLAEKFGTFFPEVKSQQEFIAKVIQEEELAFLRTLDKGLKNLESIQESLEASNEHVIPGAVAFELYDTYGFPLDLTSLIAREKGLIVDEKGFQEAMRAQKERSRAAAQLETGDWVIVYEEESEGFIGYDSLHTKARILKYRKITDKKQERFQVVLTRTPFYAESGGQVGDTGILHTVTETLHVLDTTKENDLIIHWVDALPMGTEEEFTCQVDALRRAKIKNNHTATHLLQAALKQVLGPHVQQKGSLVNEQMLRFDFSHFAKMTPEELERTETIVNARIRENIVLNEQRQVPIAEAKAMGATALFGEKYGEHVRVITFDPTFSVELCGGTHVQATGEIGFFKLVSESSTAAGVRRVEAVTAEEAEAYVNRRFHVLQEVQEVLKNPKDLLGAIESLIEERANLRKEIEGLHLKATDQIKESLKNQAKSLNGYHLVLGLIKLPNGEALKKLSFELKNEMENLVAVLAADIAGKPQVAIVISENIVEKKGLHAGKLVKELSKEIRGGGGGQPFFATAGGKDSTGLPEVLVKAEAILTSSLK